MTGGPKDPLSPLPDPWQVPADYPYFPEADATPKPADPVFPEGRAGCPHCGVTFRSTNQAQRTGDYGVCFHCRNTLIHDGGKWRMVTYDEAVEAETDTRHVLLQRNFREPTPE